MPPKTTESLLVSWPLPSESSTGASMRPPVIGSTTIRKLVPPNRHACVDGTSVVKMSRPAVSMGRKTLRSPVVVALGKSMYQPMCFDGESSAVGGVVSVDQFGVEFDTTRKELVPMVTLLMVCCRSWL